MQMTGWLAAAVPQRELRALPEGKVLGAKGGGVSLSATARTEPGLRDVCWFSHNPSSFSSSS